MTTPDDAAAIARRHERHVETPDGRVYVTEIPGGDPPIVLMNGFPDDHRIYDNLLPRLSLFADPQLTTLADDLVGDPSQLLWLLQRWGVQWQLDADDPEGIARNSILPQFYGDDHQPDAVASVRAWCAGLPDTLDQQDVLAASGTLSDLPVPVSIIWGEKDKYLGPSLAAEIAALFPNPSVHLLPGAGHYPQHDQPDTVAELLKEPGQPDHNPRQ